MAGKGSKQRPTNKEKFNANYDRIFNNLDKQNKTLDEAQKQRSRVYAEVLKRTEEELRPYIRRTESLRTAVRNAYKGE